MPKLILTIMFLHASEMYTLCYKKKKERNKTEGIFSNIHHHRTAQVVFTSKTNKQENRKNSITSPSLYNNYSNRRKTKSASIDDVNIALTNEYST